MAAWRSHTQTHTHWFLSILFPIWRLKLKPRGQAKDKSKSAIFDRFGYIWSVFNIREETYHHWLFASLKSQNRNDKTCVFSPLLNLPFETVVFDAALQTRLQIPECTWFRELQLQIFLHIFIDLDTLLRVIHETVLTPDDVFILHVCRPSEC